MNKIIVACLLLLTSEWTIAYTLPAIPLGSGSFLDGGPLRQIPGLYIQNYFQVYHSNKFVDAHGKPLPGVNNPNFNTIANAIQFIYLSQTKFLGGNLGCDCSLPIILHSGIRKNIPLFTDSGGGLGDLGMGIFIQWNPIMHGDRPIFVQRLEFDAVFPTGKNQLPQKTINPGNRIFYFNAYWSATIYFTPEFTASYRVNYLWGSKNEITHIRPGDTFFMDFAVDYIVKRKFLFGINGYYLRQLKNSTLNGISIPDSRERVFAIGPGFLYLIEPKYAFVALFNLYFEMDVRNRPIGTRFLFRLLKHF